LRRREAAKALAASLTSLAGFDLLDCSHLFAQQVSANIFLAWFAL
jgi:hypothetical protein